MSRIIDISLGEQSGILGYDNDFFLKVSADVAPAYFPDFHVLNFFHF